MVTWAASDPEIQSRLQVIFVVPVQPAPRSADIETTVALEGRFMVSTRFEPDPPLASVTTAV